MNIFRKKLKVYILIKGKKDSESSSFLSISSRQSDLKLYLRKYLRLMHLKEYKNWCSMQGLEDNDFSFDLFFMKNITQEELNTYQICKFWYSTDDLTSLIRMFAGCIPIGCPYEREIEVTYTKERLGGKI